MGIIDRLKFRSLSKDINFLRHDPVVNAHLYSPEAKALAATKLAKFQAERRALIAK